MVSALAVEPRVCGFKPGVGDGVLMSIKIRSTPSFGGEVSRRPHAKGFYGMLKNLAKYDRDTTSAKFKGISRQLSLATRCVCWSFAEGSGR
jgi:hypothetical protein